MRAGSRASIVLLLVACAPRTEVELTLRNSASIAPSNITVSAFDERGLLTRKRITSPALPGTLVVQLDDDVGLVRFSAIDDAKEWSGFASVVATALKRTSLTLTGGAELADADDDGVPDAIDNCAAVANPDQNTIETCAISTDAGVADAGIGGPSTCPVAGALRCEGFEVGEGGLLIQEENSTITFDGGSRARGLRAATLRVPQFSAFTDSYARFRDETSLPRSEWYARFFVNLSSASYPETAVLLEARSTPTYELLNLSLGSGGRLTLQRVTGGTLQLFAPDAFPLDRWVCVELGVKQTTNAEVSVWVDGVEIPSLHPDGGVTNAPSYDTLIFGLAWYAPSGHAPVEVGLDELLVMSTRIGCAR